MKKIEYLFVLKKIILEHKRYKFYIINIFIKFLNIFFEKIMLKMTVWLFKDLIMNYFTIY